MVGQTISHYRIVEKLGEGGMGVVYKAEDLKLGRAVALKFLPSHLLESEEHKARFLHEARAAALLDHPNICTIYEIDEANNRTFLAMACLEGQTLKQKIAARPLPLNEAIDIAIQIGQGLRTAHEKGIVHRDIKPANIMITPQGQVKIMDFGLAQLSDRTRLTATGVKLGTPVYMSPEQTGGKSADRRSDIWSLGVVLYEMISGRVPFTGEVEAAVTHAIVHSEPEPLTALRSGMPMDLDRIIAKALAKNRDERYQHVEEMGVDLSGLSKNLESGASGAMGYPPGRTETTGSELARGKRWRHRIIEPLLGVLLVAAVGALWLGGGEATEEAPLRKFSFSAEGVFAAAISPNGRYIGYLQGTAAPRQVVVQDLREEKPRVIQGAAGNGLTWSPGSDSLGFWTQTGLKRVAVHGGPVTALTQPLPSLLGGSWSPDGNSIVVSWQPGLYEVPAQGGKPTVLFRQDESEPGLRLTSQSFLPAQATASGLLAWTRPQSALILVELKDGRRKDLGLGEHPVYSPTGHIVYESAGGLWALPFSIQTLEPMGRAFPIRESGSQPSVSRDGTLVFLDTAPGLERLIWRDRSGRKVGEIGQPQQGIRQPALSPDGTKVAGVGMEEGGTDIWLHDVARPIKTRLTFTDALEDRPAWTRQGDQISFSRMGDIFIQPADGSGEEQVLLAGLRSEFGYEWSIDGKYLVGTSSGDIVYLRANDDGRSYEKITFLDSPADEVGPDLSPDGRFVAYESDESGRYEVYVRPFPGGGTKWPISANGGGQPRWRGDSKELFYVEGNTLMAVGVATTPTFSVGVARKLFSDERAFTGRAQRYDVSPDGQRFVVVEILEKSTPALIRVVQNWYEEFRDREPD